jgi:hypothetical protein
MWFESNLLLILKALNQRHIDDNLTLPRVVFFRCSYFRKHLYSFVLVERKIIRISLVCT